MYSANSLWLMKNLMPNLIDELFENECFPELYNFTGILWQI